MVAAIRMGLTSASFGSASMCVAMWLLLGYPPLGGFIVLITLTLGAGVANFVETWQRNRRLREWERRLA